jgi:hypothetical protein
VRTSGCGGISRPARSASKAAMPSRPALVSRSTTTTPEEAPVGMPINAVGQRVHQRRIASGSVLAS